MTATDRTEPVAVDTVITGEWIITLNAAREIYRDGAIAVTGGVITEVGKRDAILAKYRPGTLIDEPQSIVIPGMINGHRHLLCCAKGAMPEGGPPTWPASTTACSSCISRPAKPRSSWS